MFSEPDADVMLLSDDNTLFRVHSFMLQNTSALFRTLLSLPQPNEECRFTDPIPVFERDDALIPFLNMLYGLVIPQWSNYQHVERVLALAEKWDTPGPIAAIRAAITAPIFLHEPLRLYAIATHFEWEEVAQVAAAASLSTCIFDPVHEPLLSSLPAKFLDPLLELHGERRHQFRVAIDSPARFTAGNVDPFYCSACHVPIDNSSWRALKAKLFQVMDLKPSGEWIYDAQLVDTWEEAKSCWAAKCKTKSCMCLNYDKPATIRQVRGCIDLLPSTVKIDWST
jgi:hypothetical protein